MSWAFVTHNLVYGPVLTTHTKTVHFESGVEGAPIWWFTYLFLEQLTYKENSKYQQNLKKFKIWNKTSPELWEHRKLQEGRVDAEPANIPPLYNTTTWEKTQLSQLPGKWLWVSASLLEAGVSGCNGHVMHASFTKTRLYYQ